MAFRAQFKVFGVRKCPKKLKRVPARNKCLDSSVVKCQVSRNHSNNVTGNKGVFVGCSEIRISVTVKQVQHIGMVRAFCLPGGTC